MVPARNAWTPWVSPVQDQDAIRSAAHVVSGTETYEPSQAYRSRGFWIGVTGFLCQKSQPLRGFLAQHVPLDRLLVETDAPYMGFKGCRTGESDRRRRKRGPGLLFAQKGVSPG